MNFKKLIQLLTILPFLFILSAHAQTSRYKPFKLVIIAPDTAIIDPKLSNYIDSIQNAHLKSYYESIKQMENMVNFKAYPKESASFAATKKRVKKELEEARKVEPEVKKFKYFQTVSEYSSEVLNFYFNEYPPLSTIGTVPAQKTDIKSLSHLADSLKVDYIVYYHNIHTEVSNGEYTLKLSTGLFDNATKKLLFDQETSGDTESRGDMWTCSEPLICLFVTGVKSSTDILFDLLRKKQAK